MLKRSAAATLLLLSASAGDLSVPTGKHGEFPAYIPDGPSKEKPCPLVVACHGAGDQAGIFLNCLKAIADADGFALLAPEGTVAYKKGFDWNGFPDRGVAIESAIQTLLKGHPEIDPKRIVWLGHSTGGTVCCEDGASRPDLCKGIVLTGAATGSLSVSPKGPKPRVALFLGTEDFRFPQYAAICSALKASKAPCSTNQVKGLGHAFPDRTYFSAAVRWVLESEGESEDNVLPKEPPLGRACRHLLLRHKGAEGAPEDTQRTVDAARKEAEKLADHLRKEKPEKRAERAQKASEDEESRAEGGKLPPERVQAFGPLLQWACWTVPAGEVRIVRTPAGFHLVWAD